MFSLPRNADLIVSDLGFRRAGPRARSLLTIAVPGEVFSRASTVKIQQGVSNEKDPCTSEDPEHSQIAIQHSQH
jgi:hypothetical protein